MKLLRAKTESHLSITRPHALGFGRWCIGFVLMLGLHCALDSAADDAATTVAAKAETNAQTESGTAPGETTDAPSRVIQFEKLETTDNKVYEQVTVRKIEPDSLLIEHLNGVARVSMFDLSEEIQKHYEFDRDAAIEHYKRREAEQRAIRKQLFFERIRQQAADEAELRLQNLERQAKMEWIPVRAQIVTVSDGNALAYVDRIVMVPTYTKSALGGKGLPGPARKKYVRISNSPVWLRDVGEIETPSKGKPAVIWTGFVWPDGEVSLDAKEPDKTTTAYRTLKPRE